jgi:hypothetical protein
LRLNRPRWTARLLADAFLDGDFILGKTRIMSLELSHYCRTAPGGTKETQQSHFGVIPVLRRSLDAAA